MWLSLLLGNVYDDYHDDNDDILKPMKKTPKPMETFTGEYNKAILSTKCP